MAGPNFTILRILAIILLCFAPFLLPPLAMALALGESAMVFAFAVTLGVWLFAALPGIVLTRAKAFNLTSRDGFLLVFATWAAVSLLGGLPYWLGGRAGFTDAILESVASFATTGGTTLGELDKLPHSLILWRSMSYWAGGMGIVVLTVALIPVLGVGGFQLVKAETPGPDKERLTSRLSDTAKILWLVYFIFTVILALLYLAGGMSFFDAVCQSMTVISTGGESTRGEAFAFYDSKFIDAVTVVFMLLTAINYNMYFRVLKGKWRDAVNSTEIKAFFAIFVCAAAVVTLAIIPVYGSLGEALHYAAFQTASMVSSSGAIRADYTEWPALAQGALIVLMIVGGCSGSTAGGIKVIRFTVLWKQIANEIRRTLSPQGVFSVRLNKKVGRRDVIYGTAGFVFLYLMLVMVTTLATAAAGVDLFSAFSQAISVIGNVGAGFGSIGVSPDYSLFPAWLKWVYCVAMIAGRLELWTVFIVFTPAYWR